MTKRTSILGQVGRTVTGVAKVTRSAAAVAGRKVRKVATKVAEHVLPASKGKSRTVSKSRATKAKATVTKRGVKKSHKVKTRKRAA